MKTLILLALLGLLSIATTQITYSVEPPNLDSNYTIPQAQYKLAGYHFDLYLEELAKGNNDTAQEHFRLAMMQDEQRESFLDAITIFEDQPLPTVAEIKKNPQQIWIIAYCQTKGYSFVPVGEHNG